MAVEWFVQPGTFRFLLAVGVLFIGAIAGYLVGVANRRILRAAGIPEAVEGTPFERTARSLGTSTVALVAKLSSWFIYGVAVLIALHVAQLLDSRAFWIRITQFVPDLFVAVLTFIVGFVVADKAELVVGEQLRGIKLPEVTLIPRVVKYSIVYIAALIALSQVGVATGALLVLLAAYVFALVFLGGLAFRDLLASGTAGIYLLLNQPYGIGDEIEVDEWRGIVQEVDVFVTRVENDDEEYIIPNREVFRAGIVRIRS
jgi:small-conductance mechanosensitive channel